MSAGQVAGGGVLTGAERVVLIEVPAGSDRWRQVGIGREVALQFLRLQGGRSVVLQRVDANGQVDDVSQRGLVNPASNDNHRLEFALLGEYPAEGKPCLVVVEESATKYRYLVRMPGESGYEIIDMLNRRLPKFGGGLKRSVTTLTELERAWPASPIHSG